MPRGTAQTATCCSLRSRSDRCFEIFQNAMARIADTEPHDRASAGVAIGSHNSLLPVLQGGALQRNNKLDAIDMSGLQVRVVGDKEIHPGGGSAGQLDGVRSAN